MKIIQNSLLLLLLLAFALAYPMKSSENEGPERGGPGELNELKKLKESDKTLDFKQLLTLETWSPETWSPPA